MAPEQRASVLGNGWGSSTDRAVTTAGDASGFHVLVADAKDGYQWRTAASLSEPGFDVDAWIGNMCVTASGDRAVVAYAPRTFTNKQDLAQRGAFTAIVDLNGGPVRKLPVRTSLAYFNPGCGPTETAVLTQEGTEDLDRTRLLELDTATGATGKPIEIPGQLTSPVPTAQGIVAADAGAMVRVAADGTRTVLARTKGVPYRLAADADGGVVFLQDEGKKAVSVQRVTVPATGRGALTTLAAGDLMSVNVASVRGGQVLVTGDKSTKVRSAPASVRLADVAKNGEPSLNGGLAVTKVLRAHTKDPRVAPPDPLSPQRVDVSAVSMDTGKEFTLSVLPVDGAGGGNEPSPALPAGVTGSPSDPSEGTDERYCAIPRNNPRMQVMQPKPRQVEWAVNQAVLGVLNVSRPANWKGLGMPAYTPQGLFPPKTLSGGGYLPSQVMLGVLAQESNMWQAARFAIPGMTANPLIGNYYGIDYYNDTPADDWTIHWNEADCGYGVGQITDGMRLAGKEKPGETALPVTHQQVIAFDFAGNVAKAVQMLQEKWNQTRAAGLVINNGQAKWIENWFFAVWAYNSGFYPQSTAGQNNGAWGVGWLNNPVNPRYPANRTPFLDETYADAAHPQDWPYPEKVMGWAGHPVELIESPNVLVPGYRAAWWLTEQDRWDVKPSNYEFCDASNDCNPDLEVTPDDPDVIGEPAGPCLHKSSAGKYDLKCWYHQAAGWKDCGAAAQCGNEKLRFDAGYPYQEDGNSYPPNCSLSGLPSNALVIDNLSTSTPPQRPGCTIPHTNAGSFTFNFTTTGTLYPSKIDMHQIGTGFAGQFWMSNTHEADNRVATGTWAFNRSVGNWGRILVHLPVVGARTQQAEYKIDTGSGYFNRKRFLPQEIRRNGWVSLGVYNFTGIPRIQLSNKTEDGNSTVRIAWDAVAIQPLGAKPRHIVAALGDSYTSGEGAGTYLVSSDVNHGTPQWNACRRSNRAWPREVLLPGTTTPLGQLSDGFSANHELGFVACSGAKTWNVIGDGVPYSWGDPGRYESGDGQYHEMNQLESGVLDENTTLVAMTIGGNDGNGFSLAIQDCVLLPQCQDSPNFMSKYRGLADNAVTNTEDLLRKVATRARNAQIVLMGYPELLSRSNVCITAQLALNEQIALAEIVNYLSGKQQEMVTRLKNEGMKVSFMNMVPEFAGHGGCDSPEWVNTIRVGPYGEGDYHAGDRAGAFCIPFTGGNCMSRESFHPNLYGTAAYAFALRLKLNEIGYT